MRSDIAPGGNFPDYELPDETGKLRTLSELQGNDPLVLTLSRGHYCPKEHQQHLELAAFYSKIVVAYTQIATISTDDHHTLQEFRLSVGAQWTFLSDPGARFSSPGLMVTTRNIATFVSTDETSCGRVETAESCAVRGFDAILDAPCQNELPSK